MHRRVLPGELSRYYLQDLLGPAAAAGAAVALATLAAPGTGCVAPGVARLPDRGRGRRARAGRRRRARAATPRRRGVRGRRVKPTVAVLVPTYRRPALLRRTLASITTQRADGFDVEVWVYDNASGDDTERVAREAGTGTIPVRYVQRPYNIGSVRNFIGAIRDVRAAFFAIISDDDVLLPGALQISVSSLIAHPAATAWNGVTLSASERQLIAYRPAPQWPMGLTDGLVALDLISRNIRPETTGMVFRSAVVDDQFYDDDDAFLAQDLLWLCRAARAGSIGVSPQPTGILYSHDQSLSAGGAATQASVLFPAIPRLCEMLRTWDLPEPLAARVVPQFQTAFGAYGLTLLGYRAILAGDTDGIAAVERTAGAHPWLGAVAARLARARRQPHVLVWLALVWLQLTQGNPRHKLSIVWWRLVRWPRYRAYLRT